LPERWGSNIRALVIFPVIIVCSFLADSEALTAFNSPSVNIFYSNSAQRCYEVSYKQVSDSILTEFDTRFEKAGVKGDPFATIVFLIGYFSAFEDAGDGGYSTLDDVVAYKRGNKRSLIITVCAMMQRMGWDVQYLHNGREHYLGINFSDAWVIRQGHWVESDGRRYYLKEFDNITPAGEVVDPRPAESYQCLKIPTGRLRPIPLVSRLPYFKGRSQSMRLGWEYEGTYFGLTISIPEEQVEWTRNLPASLYGMAASGMLESENLDCVNRLKSLVREYDEYGRVNFLLKFCQSDEIFSYDSTLPIISVSRQFLEAKNDCDGRSVLLYCLLRTVLDYPTSHIVFVDWPYHVALALKPMTGHAAQVLGARGVNVGNGYYVLDPSYVGDTSWGSSIGFLPENYRLIYP
jgi:hypothetical protein